MVKQLDLFLIVFLAIFMIADILLCFLIKYALPQRISSKDQYVADGASRNFDDAVKICPCLQGVFPNGTNEKISFIKIPKQALSKRSATNLRKDLFKHPYLLSLSRRVANNSQTFACNGLVQSREWLLTTKACVQNAFDWYNLTVRSESAFWSIGGKEHAVVDVNDKDKILVYLRVFPKFPSTIVPIPPFGVAPGGKWARGLLLGWDDQLKNDPTSNFKSKPFDLEKWYPYYGNSSYIGDSQVCDRLPKCGVSSQFLITQDHWLIAVKSAGGQGCNGFLSLTSNADKKSGNCYPLMAL